jgi:hypothetical protein
MPALHKIDNEVKLITTIWSGEATANDLIDALTKYQQDVRSQADYFCFNEIVDFSKTSDFKLSTAGLRKLVQIAADSDVQGVKTKLAIIVSSPVAYGLARMYEAYRTLVPSLYKEVRVFKNYSNALEWITGNSLTDS